MTDMEVTESGLLKCFLYVDKILFGIVGRAINTFLSETKCIATLGLIFKVIFSAAHRELFTYELC